MIENVQKVLLAVLEFIRVELKNRIQLFVERAMEALAEQPYKSFSARQQARAAERWLAKGSAHLVKALHQRLMDNFTHQEEKKEIAYEELQLLDDESLNVVMMRARLVNSVMEHARELLVEVDVRLEALVREGAKVNARAFSPGAIADSFMETLEKLDVPAEVQIVLMEAYSDNGAEMIADFYRDLNELLIANGVMPDYKYTVSKPHADKTRHTGPAGGIAHAQPGVAMGPGGLMSGGGTAPGGMPGEAVPGAEEAPEWPSVPAGATLPAHFAQILDAKLNVMQQALAHLTAEEWTPGTLRDTFKLPPPISISPEQEESIDHIEAVFLDLIRDTRISARFRSEFNRLILPLMSLRLTDEDLFKNPENPVRRFIRQLALLGFRDKEFAIQEFEHISLIVGRIVAERGQEIASFNSGADALYTIARNEVQRQLEARYQSRKPAHAEETADAASEKLALEAHRFVRDSLRTMSAGMHLPTVVQHFVTRLLAPWMMHTFQKHGEESDEFRDSLLYASNFFDLLEPATSEDKHTLNVQLRQQSLEQIAFEVLRSRTRTEEVIMLLEGVAGYFEELDADPDAGLVRTQGSEDESYVSYLDDLPIARSQ